MDFKEPLCKGVSLFKAIKGFKDFIETLYKEISLKEVFCFYLLV